MTNLEATKKTLISIVSPAHNEAKNIPIMVQEVRELFDSMSKSENACDFEYILVNDGSSDDTWEVIKAESQKDARVRGFCLSRNFGHQIAVTVGLDNAKGDAVIYCDSDLQHPPATFLEMLKKWREGFYVVHTKRVSTEAEGLFKKMFSNLFYGVINALSDVRIERGMADFKLLDRKVLDQLKLMREVNRFLRGMVPWLGFKSCEVAYTARKRIYGKPWYNFKRNVEFAKVGILTFSIKPLKYIGYFGIILTLFSCSFIAISMFLFFKNHSWYFSPMVNLVILLTCLIGIVLISLGIMSLYLSYVYSEVVDRPLYVISDAVNDQ